MGAMIVTDLEKRPLGMFTLQDLLRVNVRGISLDTPIGQIMSTQVITLPRQAPAWEAALAMTRHGVHYVLVVDGGRFLGVISGRDLFSLQRIGLAPLSTLLHEANSLEDLIQAAADIRSLAGTLVDQGVEAEQITNLISNLNDQLTLRIFQLECSAAECTDIEFCWMSLGSEGRYEQTLHTDQDNAIIFSDPQEGDCSALRRRLLPMARRINEILDRCGFPLCKGEVMASNPRWCLSCSEWKETFSTWIQRGDAPVLLNATIFFDFRALFGNATLVTELREWLNTYLKPHWLFFRKLTQNALANHPPLGWLHDFTLDGVGEQAHTLDLKVHGSAIFVDAARLFALAAGVAETPTVRRLRGAAAVWRQDEAATEAWIRAFELLQGLRLRHQRDQLRLGREPDNRINPRHLNDLDRRILKESLKQAKWLQEAMERNFQF